MDQLGQLHALLTKAGVTDDNIANGVSLTQSGMQKVAAKFGVDVAHVATLLGQLAEQLRGDADLDEQAALSEAEGDRFSMERDYLGNVTIRDAQTGKQAYLQGDAAGHVLRWLQSGADEQSVLARFEPMMESEAAHFKALERTGFYGEQGAGCVILAEDTGRLLLAHRSKDVEQPGAWGGWGGALDADEDPISAVEREVGEEAGYHGPIEAIIPLYVFKKGAFAYYNFLVVVAHEFEPKLNFESQGAKWCTFGDWPKPLHFGLQALFSDADSIHKIQQRIRPVQAESLNEDDLDEDESYDDEIRANVGTFNFPWKIQGRHGFATARFAGRGDRMKVTVVNVRDHQGDVIDAPSLMPELHSQAVAFIGEE